MQKCNWVRNVGDTLKLEVNIREFHQDNAGPQTALVTQQILTKVKVVTLLQPSYSSDLAPCDFWRAFKVIDLNQMEKLSVPLNSKVIHCNHSDSAWPHTTAATQKFFGSKWFIIIGIQPYCRKKL